MLISDKLDIQQVNSKGFLSSSTDSSVSFKEGECTSMAVSNSSVSVTHKRAPQIL